MFNRVLNKSLDVAQRLKFALLNEVSNGCQYQSFLSNVKINDLLKSLNTDQIRVICTAQKLKFSIKDFLSKCDQIRSLLKKLSMEKFIFLCSVGAVDDYFNNCLWCLHTFVTFLDNS